MITRNKKQTTNKKKTFMAKLKSKLEQNPNNSFSTDKASPSANMQVVIFGRWSVRTIKAKDLKYLEDVTGIFKLYNVFFVCLFDFSTAVSAASAE